MNGPLTDGALIISFSNRCVISAQSGYNDFPHVRGRTNSCSGPHCLRHKCPVVLYRNIHLTSTST
uniref:Uncharacterized protein n=1 Tax=Anguilla anguilla TaxID=7936 RepID=A0A0E9PR52_ANGAN